MEIVKNIVEEDIILSNHKLSDKEIIRAYSALVKKLNKHIVDLKIDNDLLIEELELYKKALELASIFMEEKCDWNSNLLPVYVEKEIIFDYFLQQAKEKVDEQKASEKEQVE